jgi:hypothetical protein
MFRSHLTSLKKVCTHLALQDVYKIESTFFIIQSYTIASLFEMSESGNNSSTFSGSSAADAPFTTEELMTELRALRAEMAEMKAREAASAAAATPKEALSTTTAPATNTSASQALVRFTPATGGAGRPSSPPRATHRRSWNSYRSAQRLAARMSQAAAIALHAVLESGGSLEAAAEAGRAAARRAATPPPSNKRK